MGVSGGLVVMWLLYVGFGIFPIIYVTVKGGKRR